MGAQALFHEDDDEKGEAEVLNLLTEIYIADEQHDKAGKAAERARALWRSVSSKVGEANAMIMLAQSQIAIQAKKTDARGQKGGWDKVMKTAKDAVALARKMSDSEQGSEYVA